MPNVVKIREDEKADQAAISDLRYFLCILVVEDDDDLRRITATLLRDAGYRVDEAQDGAEAWEAVRNNVYDLIVTDNNMPRMTGIDLLNKLHSSQIKIPTILVTGEIPTDQLRRCPWLQIEAVVLKPFMAVQLLTMVENIFNGLAFNETSKTSKFAVGPAESSHNPLSPGRS